MLPLPGEAELAAGKVCGWICVSRSAEIEVSDADSAGSARFLSSSTVIVIRPESSAPPKAESKAA